MQVLWLWLTGMWFVDLGSPFLRGSTGVGTPSCRGTSGRRGPGRSRRSHRATESSPKRIASDLRHNSERSLFREGARVGIDPLYPIQGISPPPSFTPPPSLIQPWFARQKFSPAAVEGVFMGLCTNVGLAGVAAHDEVGGGGRTVLIPPSVGRTIDDDTSNPTQDSLWDTY